MTTLSYSPAAAARAKVITLATKVACTAVETSVVTSVVIREPLFMAFASQTPSILLQ